MVAGCMAALAAPVAFAQATLPTSCTGPWQGYEPPAGWIFSGLGSPDYGPDYDGNNDGAAKLDDAGDFISIHFDGVPGPVSFWIRGLTFSGGVFRVEQSLDGTNWMELALYAPPPTNATLQNLTPSIHARHVRFVYAERVTGNVGLDGISIAANPLLVIERLVRVGEGGRVTVWPTVPGRRYGLQSTTNLAAQTVAWSPISDSYATTNELELIDPLVAYPRYYRVLDITP